MFRLSLFVTVAWLGIAQAAEPPLRSFVMPPGTDDDHPVPRAIPAPRVEIRLPAPPGPNPGSDSAFALACSAGEAALTEPAPSTAAQPRCADLPYTVLTEFP